jgi:hypothetical protein
MKCPRCLGTGREQQAVTTLPLGRCKLCLGERWLATNWSGEEVYLPEKATATLTAMTGYPDP